MRTFSTAAALAAWQQQRTRATLHYFQVRHEQMVREIVAEMYRLTSGGLSLRYLASIGHPFGRGPRRNGLPRGTAPKLPINRQRGGLQSRLFMRRVMRTLSKQIIDAGFRAGANWVLLPNGTKRMVGRGFWVAIAAFAKKAQRRLLDDVWKYEFSYR